EKPQKNAGSDIVVSLYAPPDETGCLAPAKVTAGQSHCHLCDRIPGKGGRNCPAEAKELSAGRRGRGAGEPCEKGVLMRCLCRCHAPRGLMEKTVARPKRVVGWSQLGTRRTMSGEALRHALAHG